MAQTADFQQEYLEAVLAWLNVRLETEVRRWQLAGQNPADRLRGLYVSDEEALTLAQRSVGTRWSTGVELPGEEEQALEDAQAAALEKISALETQAENAGESLRLAALRPIFKLSQVEWWALIICLAPALDLRYERIYSYLQDDVTRVTASVNLILNLLLPEGLARLNALNCFEQSAPLLTNRLLEPVEETGKPFNRLRQAFQVSPGVNAWVLGNYSAAAALGSWAEIFPFIEHDEQDENGTGFGENMPAVDVLEAVRPLVSMQGGDVLQRQMAARQTANTLRRPLLQVHLAQGEAPDAALQKLHLVARDASMLNALLYIENSEVLVDGDGCLLAPAFEALRLTDDCVLLGGRRAFKLNADMPGNDFALMQVPFAELTATDRAGLWSALLEGVSDDLPQKEIEILAGQFALSSGQVVTAASAAMSRALQDRRPLRVSDLFDAARFHSEHHLDELAHKIEPRYSWEDLVVPETSSAMLRELVSMVRLRPMVLETWGLGRKLTAGAGISALFSGPPGTGKTLAAQIMANQLGIDLYRIDLSTVVSKYVGETEKNLERIFTEASASNAILFFDEADAIFGKRSEVKDAHDRYANIEVGYLLQRMESYNGVAILATNLRANLDEAFTRRLQFIINFPFPDEAYRQRIWEVLLPPDLPVSADLDLKVMAKRFKLAGGSIRNIIFSAAFLAAADGGVVNMTHLLHGAKREIQKMGKLLQETDFVL